MTDLKMETKIFILIFSKSVSGNAISDYTGIAKSTISHIRNGERHIDNLSIKVGRKLADCYDTFEKEGKLSYDRDLINAYKHYSTMKFEKK